MIVCRARVGVASIAAIDPSLEISSIVGLNQSYFWVWSGIVRPRVIHMEDKEPLTWEGRVEQRFPSILYDDIF